MTAEWRSSSSRECDELVSPQINTHRLR